MTQADHITVTHGNLTVDVPRKLFHGPDCEIDETASESFKDMVRGRYPWLSDNSVNVLMSKAQKEMVRIMDEETKGIIYSSTLADRGKLEEAIGHMRLHIEMDPDNADSWYTLGTLLCKAGDSADGYKAFNKGRELALRNQGQKRPQRRDR